MTTRSIIRGALAALLVCVAASPAPAQNRPSVVDPKGCAPSERLQSDGKVPQSMGNEPLSDKLARTDGVICPPNVDPEIKAPTPDTGNRMPVVPPPGGPGGDQTVRPK
jgi:hypothetical protein